MAVLTVNEIVGGGKSATYAAAASLGDQIPAGTDERTFLHVKNGGGSAVTVSFPPAVSVEKMPGVGTFQVPTLSGSVAAGGDMLFGPFPRDYIGGSGTVQVTYSATASVTVAAYHLGKAD